MVAYYFNAPAIFAFRRATTLSRRVAALARRPSSRELTLHMKRSSPMAQNTTQAKRVSATSATTKEKIAILDAGAQYGKVIDRRVRELAVECDLLPLSTPAADLGEYAAIIVSGGPQSVYAADAPAYDAEIFELGVPLLGICYGLQLLNYTLGGTVEKKARREDGAFKINCDSTSALFDGIPASTEVSSPTATASTSCQRASAWSRPPASLLPRSRTRARSSTACSSTRRSTSPSRA